MLALRAAGASPPAATIGWLIRQQDSDGGFNFATRGGLERPRRHRRGARGARRCGWRRARGGRSARARAIRFLRRQQDRDGGFAGQPGAGSNAQSTAFAVQGLLAAGVDPSSVRRRGASPLDYLRSLIAPDGHVRYSRGTDQTPVWVTAEALMALDGKAAAARAGAPRIAPRPARPRPPTRDRARVRPHHAERRRIARHAGRRARGRSPSGAAPCAERPAPSSTPWTGWSSDAGILTA